MAKTPKKKSDKLKGAKSGGAKKTAKPASARKARGGGKSSKSGAADAFVNLLQSPLVADLVAVAATAAIGALASKNASGGKGTKAGGNAVKAAGKAAATAIGRRLSEEVDAIKKASKGATKS